MAMHTCVAVRAAKIMVELDVDGVGEWLFSMGFSAQVAKAFAGECESGSS